MRTGAAESPKLTAPHGVGVSSSLLGLLLWAILSAVSAGRPLRYILPTFVKTPVNITAFRGTDVELPCAVHNLGPKMVVWKKWNQINPITIGEYVYDPDNSYSVKRVSLEYDPRSREGRGQVPLDTPAWNLRITDVQMRHAGVYECQVSTKENFIRNVTLTVIDAPDYDRPPPPRRVDGKPHLADETGIRLEGSQFVEKGGEIVLNCTATAIDYRPKGVDWFKDGSKVKSDARVLITETSDDHVLTSTLEVQRSNMSDAGTYVCRSSKAQVASKKVIVLNTESFNRRRDSEGADGVTSGLSPDRKLHAGLASSSGTPASPFTATTTSSHFSSVFLLQALLCWPLVRGVVELLIGGQQGR